MMALATFPLYLLAMHNVFISFVIMFISPLSCARSSSSLWHTSLPMIFQLLLLLFHTLLHPSC